MRMIDLIQRLEDLYSTYDDEYKHHMGEPEIMIDIFGEGDEWHTFEYKGFSPIIHIDKTADGVYDVIRAFETEEDHESWKSLNINGKVNILDDFRQRDVLIEQLIAEIEHITKQYGQVVPESIYSIYLKIRDNESKHS